MATGKKVLCRLSCYNGVMPHPRPPQQLWQRLLKGEHRDGTRRDSTRLKGQGRGARHSTVYPWMDAAYGSYLFSIRYKIDTTLCRMGMPSVPGSSRVTWTNRPPISIRLPVLHNRSTCWADRGRSRTIPTIETFASADHGCGLWAAALPRASSFLLRRCHLIWCLVVGP